MKKVLPAVLLAAIVAVVTWYAVTHSARDFTQTVSVHVTHLRIPAAGVDLRYYSSPKCLGFFVAGTTDVDGAFKVQRTARRGRYVVVLEKPSLCYRQNADWLELWETIQDPPNNMVISCDQDASFHWSCTRAPGLASGV